MKTNHIIIILLSIIVAMGAYISYGIYKSNAQKIIPDLSQNKETENSQEDIKQDKDKTLVGGDKDSHNCIASAGYLWCDAKQKCLRPFEEICLSDEDKTQLEKSIKQQLVSKHGDVAKDLTVTAKKIDGTSVEGSADEKVGGGGLWFAIKKSGGWKLIWDGNGIILCSDLVNYQDFSKALLPECFDNKTNSIVQR